MKGMLPKYFSSEWSFAQFRIPATRTICAFGNEANTLIIIGADGSFYKVAFGKGVECEKKFFAYFVKTEDEKRILTAFDEVKRRHKSHQRLMLSVRERCSSMRC